MERGDTGTVAATEPSPAAERCWPAVPEKLRPAGGSLSPEAAAEIPQGTRQGLSFAMPHQPKVQLPAVQIDTGYLHADPIAQPEGMALPVTAEGVRLSIHSGRNRRSEC